MKYVLLAYRDKKQVNAMSASVRAVFEAACEANVQDLKRSGHLYAIEDHQNNSIVVEVVSGRVSFTSSPFGEPKRLPVQLFFIHAMDLNAAIQIASQMPQARTGVVEVRPIMEFGSGGVSEQ